MSALQFVDSPERGVLLLDSDLTVICANSRAAEVLSTKLEELIGSPLPECVHRRPEHPDEVIEEVLHPQKSQGVVLHRYSGPLYGSHGELVGRVEIYSDITARRQLEKEILDRNRELVELNKQLQKAQDELLRSERLRALGEMAAGIAHNINNALSIVLGNVQLAKRKLSQDSDLAHCIDSIELAARDAAEIVRKLKEIGKPVDRSRYKPIELSSLVESVLDAALPAWQKHEKKQIDLATEMDTGCIIEGDATEIREAVANILLNAIQAVGDHGKISVSVHQAENQAVLTVADNGVGMDEETKERMFDPFFTTRGSEGTGLGMSMVAIIAMKHRGTVGVESSEGQGTVVTLSLPLLKSDENQ